MSVKHLSLPFQKPRMNLWQEKARLLALLSAHYAQGRRTGTRGSDAAFPLSSSLMAGHKGGIFSLPRVSGGSPAQWDADLNCCGLR